MAEFVSDSTKSCPFCGLTEHLRLRSVGSMTGDMPDRPYRVVCGNIDHDSVDGPVDYGRHAAISAWNTRAAPPAMDREAVELDWRLVAKLAGEHGVRYRTNRAFEQFVTAILSTLSADAIRQGEGATTRDFRAVPDGWKLVPIELSQDMLEAVVQLDWKSTHDPLWQEYWATLIAAAPSATPASHASDGGEAA